jgi:hypothetical protein
MKTKNMWFVFLVLAIFMAPVSVLGQEENETPTDETNDTEVPEEEVPEDETPEEEIPEEEAPEDEGLEGDAGTTPDSPLWGIDVALDRLRLALAGGASAKARVGLEIAQERLLEIKAMAEARNEAALARADEEHGQTVERVRQEIESFDGTPVDNETLRGIELGMQNHLEALAKVRARIAANENIPDDVKARLDVKFESLEGRAEELRIRIENKRTQIEIRGEGIKERIELRMDEEEENETEDEGNETDELEDEEENETEDDNSGSSNSGNGGDRSGSNSGSG